MRTPSPDQITRRASLRHVSFAVAGLSLTSNLAPLFAAPEKRRFKIGACEWSFRKSDPTCFDVAKQIGLDGVQVNMGNAKNNMWLRRPEVQRDYIEAAKRTGLEIASLAMGELNQVGL